MELETAKRLAQKMDWEGGAEALADYGGRSELDSYDVPESCREAWRNFCDALDKLYEELNKAGAML